MSVISKQKSRWQKEWVKRKKEEVKATKKIWWTGFNLITFLSFISAISNRWGYEAFVAWLTILILFAIGLFFVYRKALEEIDYLKTFAEIENDDTRQKN